MVQQEDSYFKHEVLSSEMNCGYEPLIKLYLRQDTESNISTYIIIIKKSMPHPQEYLLPVKAYIRKINENRSGVGQ